MRNKISIAVCNFRELFVLAHQLLQCLIWAKWGLKMDKIATNI